MIEMLGFKGGDQGGLHCDARADTKEIGTPVSEDTDVCVSQKTFRWSKSCLSTQGSSPHWPSRDYEAVDTCTVDFLIGRCGLFRTICSSFVFLLKVVLFLLFSGSVVSDLCNPKDCSTPGFPVPHYLPEFAQFMSIESVMLSNLSTSATPFSSCLQSFHHQGLFSAWHMHLIDSISWFRRVAFWSSFLYF